MKTFKDFLIENADGNYVCIDSENLSNVWHKLGIAEPVTGESPPEGDYHCTLIYSKNTYTAPDSIMNAMKRYGHDTAKLEATVIGAECFDSVPKDGERDSSKSCIVLKLSEPTLVTIHNQLKALGLQHSYAEFSPHVTLRYNMSVEEAHFYKDKINEVIGRIGTIKLHGLKSQAINKNYV